jgi:hypothetical protein
MNLCRNVWVITIDDPANDEFIDVTYGVYESEKSANSTWEELSTSEDKQEGVKYYVEEVPMYLDYNLLSQ